MVSSGYKSNRKLFLMNKKNCRLKMREFCSDSGIDDEDATKFIYNNGNITAGVAAKSRREKGRMS